MLAPLAAAPGDLLIAWPGHPTHALSVVRRGVVVRNRWMELPALTGEWGRLEDSGIIAPSAFEFQSAELLQRLA